MGLHLGRYLHHPTPLSRHFSSVLSSFQSPSTLLSLFLPDTLYRTLWKVAGIEGHDCEKHEREGALSEQLSSQQELEDSRFFSNPFDPPSTLFPGP